MNYAELWRPQYHYSTLDSQTGDPNGLLYYKGVYHLYYQCMPHQQTSRQHWGHAISTDLIHWTEQEPALFPDDLGNIWSGTGAVDHNNTSGFFSDTEDGSGIVVAYSTNTQHVGIAYSKDGGMTFTKVSTTEPVVANPGIRAFRDPHIFWHPETNKWKMVVAGHGGSIWIYEAEDLVHWELCSVDHKIYTECPNLIRMRVNGSDEEKWVLTCVGRRYYIGTFDGRTFTPETDEIIFQDGPDTYAGITFSDMPDGRTVMINWLFDQKNWFSSLPFADKKWNGAYSVPVELKLIRVGSTYRILQMPVQELEIIKRDRLLSVSSEACQPGENPLACCASNRFILETQIDLRGSEPISLRVCEGDEDAAIISYDPASGCMTIDGRRNKYGPNNKKQISLYSLYLDPLSMPDQKLRLLLLADVSYLELFVNDGWYYFAMQIYPTPDAKRMSLTSPGTHTIDHLTVDECGSIWFEDAPCDAPVQLPAIYGTPIPEEQGITYDVKSIRPFLLKASCIAVHGNDLRIQKFMAGSASTIIESTANFTVCTDVLAHGEGIADIIFHAADANHFCCLSLDFSKKTIQLWQKVQGGRTVLCEQPYALSPNRAVPIRLDVNSADTCVFVDGLPFMSTTDLSFHTGRLCLNVRAADVEFNRFSYWIAL